VEGRVHARVVHWETMHRGAGHCAIQCRHAGKPGRDPIGPNRAGDSDVCASALMGAFSSGEASGKGGMSKEERGRREKRERMEWAWKGPSPCGACRLSVRGR
jgi:hypothetical protein